MEPYIIKIDVSDITYQSELTPHLCYIHFYCFFEYVQRCGVNSPKQLTFKNNP